MKLPKAIISHPAVEECLDGEAEGFDYKYNVWLKEEFRFKLGRMAGCRTGNFHNVKDFLAAQPERIAA